MRRGNADLTALDYDDPDKRAAHQLQYTLLEALPRELRAVLWGTIIGLDIRHPAQTVLNYLDQGQTEAAAVAAATWAARQAEDEAIAIKHYQELRAGRAGNLHRLAGATPLRDAHLPPRRPRRRREDPAERYRGLPVPIA